MNTPSYIASNHEELFEKSPAEIQNLILDGDIEKTTETIAENYKIPVGLELPLYDLISFTLTGALPPEKVTQALQDMVEVSAEDAQKIAQDLEHSIFEKARISLSVKPVGTEVKTLEFQGARSKEELRKELLDTTKRESALTKNPVPATFKKKPTVLAPGSRSQLMEQLEVLGSIPNDEEITNRLSHIQEQISLMKKEEEDTSLESKIALKNFMFGEKGKEIADPTINKLTYSVAPTKYNVDPYREIGED